MTRRERQEIATEDGRAEAWLCRPDGAGPWPGVLFFMDGLGVRPILVDMAARLASHGYVVLLPDLFYRAGPRELMGGSFSLLAAGTYPQRVRAAACLHGARLATADAGSPHLRAREITGRLYVGVAESDPWLADGEMKRLESALKNARVDYEMEMYAGTQHGFAVDDLPVYDHTAAERHWQQLSGLFGRSLAQG